MLLNKHKLANIITYLVVFQVILFRFLNVHEKINKVILALILIVIFLVLQTGKIKFTRLNIPSILTFFLIIANGVVNGFSNAYKSNFLMLLYSLMYTIFMGWYIKSYPKKVEKTLDKLYIPLNIYMWLNLLVMIIQMQGTYFMVGISEWKNTAYYDLISGLFGYSTTHVVCIFSTFVFLYDYVSFLSAKKENKKIAYQINLIALIIVNFIISIFNDNIGLFFLFPLTFGFFIIFKNNLKTSSKILKIVIGTLTLIVVSTIILTCMPSISNFINKEIWYKITGLFKNMNNGTAVSHGSMERLAQIVYGLKYLNGWKLGKGLSYTGLFHNGMFGFAHFGNASAGGVVCLAGIWTWISYSMTIADVIHSILPNHKKLFWGATIYILLVTIYTTIFTDVSIMISTIFIGITFWYAYRKGVTDEKQEYQNCCGNCHI